MTSAKPNALLAASAIVYFAASVALLFAPAEIGAFVGAPPDAGRERLLQVIGGALLGFAMLNWSSRHSRTAGCPTRP